MWGHVDQSDKNTTGIFSRFIDPQHLCLTITYYHILFLSSYHLFDFHFVGVILIGWVFILDTTATSKWSQCQFCKLVITTVNLWRHIRTQHTDQPPLQCEYCQKSFKNKYSKREHIRKSYFPIFYQPANLKYGTTTLFEQFRAFSVLFCSWTFVHIAFCILCWLVV